MNFRKQSVKVMHKEHNLKTVVKYYIKNILVRRSGPLNGGRSVLGQLVASAFDEGIKILCREIRKNLDYRYNK